MYMFQQFYKEFTPDLLSDFFGNDKFRLNELFEKVNEIKIDDGKMNEWVFIFLKFLVIPGYPMAVLT